MKEKLMRHSGFTVVELLIVIVVIGILAALVVTGYANTQHRAKTTAMISNLRQAANQLIADKAVNGQFPASLAAANGGSGVSSGDDETYQYLKSYSGSIDHFCLLATNGELIYGVTEKGEPVEGGCRPDVGWWQLNGDGNDASGYSGVVAPAGATVATGANGEANGAYEFTASTQNLQGPVSHPVSTHLTLSAWVKPSSYTPGLSTIILGHNSHGYYLSLADDGSLRSYWYGTSPAGYHATPSNSVPLQQWSHAAATWDGTNARLYVNGQLLRTVAVTGSGTSPQTINIGAQNAARQFYGSIDDVRVYGRALNQFEIDSLYRAGAQ